MKEPWVDFKTDEETFKIIMEYEEEFVRKIIKEKYDRAKNNPISKANEDMLKLATKLIELDVLCANKLKEKNKDLRSFFSSPDNLMIRKIILAYDLNLNEVEKITLRLPSEAYSMFMCYFGIDRKKVDLKNITKIFDITPREFYKNTLQILRQLEFNIKVIRSNKKEKIKIPSMLMIEIEKKGYERKEIIDALNIYDDKTKNALQKYYGYNYSSAKSPLIPIADGDDVIINSVLDGENNIDVQITKLRAKKAEDIKRLKKTPLKVKEETFNLIKFYKSKGYSSLDFLNAYRSLSDKDCALIKRKYDKDFNEIKDVKLSYKEKGLIFELTRSEDKGIGKALIEMTKKEISKITANIEQPKKNSLKTDSNKKPESIPTIAVKKKAIEEKKIIIPVTADLKTYYESIGITGNDLEKYYQKISDDDLKTFCNYISVLRKLDGTNDFIVKKDIDSSISRHFTEYIPNKINVKKGIKNFKTFNDYCDGLGFDNEDLETMYNELNEKEKARFIECIDVTEDEEHKHIFTLTKRLTQKEDQINHQYYTQSVIIRLCKIRVRNGKNVDKLELSKNVRKRIKSNSTKTYPKIRNYKNLNDYYKALGFDDSDLEALYSSLEEYPIRKDYFNRLLDIIEEKKDKHIFAFKTPSSNLSKKDRDYFAKYIPISMCKHRIKFGKTNDEIKLSSSAKKAGETNRSAPPIKNFKTFNDYCKALGFDDNDLEGVYKQLTKEENGILSETTKITETKDKKHIFTFTKAIEKGDEKGYYFYTHSMPVKLYRFRVTHNKSTDKLNLAKSVEKYISLHSPKAKRIAIITNYKTLNDYYKALGFDDNDLEEVYKQLTKKEKAVLSETTKITETKDKKHIFTLTKAIEETDKKSYYFYTKTIPVMLYRFRVTHSKSTDKLNLPKNVEKYIGLHSPKTNRIAIITNYENLNEYYKSLGFDDDDLEYLYSSLASNSFRHNWFHRLMNIVEENENRHIFTLKKAIDLNKDDIRYLMQDIPKSLCTYRLGRGKDVTKLNLIPNLANFLEKKIKEESDKKGKDHTCKVKIDFCKTLNEYYKNFGITDEKLTLAYKSAKQGKKYFDEVTKIIKVSDENYKFEIKGTIKHGTAAYLYFTRNLLVYLKPKTKPKENENPQNNLVIEEERSFEEIKEYISEYISGIKAEHIITKELLLKLKLPKLYEYFLLSEFVVNKNNEVSLEEEAEILNIDVYELCKILINGITLLKEEINKRMSFNSEKNIFSIQEENPTDDGNTDMKKTLK